MGEWRGFIQALLLIILITIMGGVSAQNSTVKAVEGRKVEISSERVGYSADYYDYERDEWSGKRKKPKSDKKRANYQSRQAKLFVKKSKNEKPSKVRSSSNYRASKRAPKPNKKTKLKKARKKEVARDSQYSFEDEELSFEDLQPYYETTRKNVYSIKGKSLHNKRQRHLPSSKSNKKRKHGRNHHKHKEKKSLLHKLDSVLKNPKAKKGRYANIQRPLKKRTNLSRLKSKRKSNLSNLGAKIEADKRSQRETTKDFTTALAESSTKKNHIIEPEKHEDYKTGESEFIKIEVENGTTTTVSVKSATSALLSSTTSNDESSNLNEKLNEINSLSEESQELEKKRSDEGIFPKSPSTNDEGEFSENYSIDSKEQPNNQFKVSKDRDRVLINSKNVEPDSTESVDYGLPLDKKKRKFRKSFIPKDKSASGSLKTMPSGDMMINMTDNTTILNSTTLETNDTENNMSFSALMFNGLTTQGLDYVMGTVIGNGELFTSSPEIPEEKKTTMSATDEDRIDEGEFHTSCHDTLCTRDKPFCHDGLCSAYCDFDHQCEDLEFFEKKKLTHCAKQGTFWGYCVPKPKEGIKIKAITPKARAVDGPCENGNPRRICPRGYNCIASRCFKFNVLRDDEDYDEEMTVRSMIIK